MKYLKYIISILALAIAIIRIVWPTLEIDGITLILIALAAIPWIGSVVLAKQAGSQKEVNYQNLDELQDKAKKAGLLRSSHTKKASKPINTPQIGLFGQVIEENNISKDDSDPQEEKTFYKNIFDADQLLALAGIRLEIGKHIKQLSENFLSPDKSYNTENALNLIYNNGIITKEEKDLIRDLINTLNKSIHGEVEYKNGKIMLDIGQNVVQHLKGKG